MPQERDRAAARGARTRRASRWSASRAATRSCSAAAARRPRRCAPRGIPFEVVPGVTAGVAAPAYAGIPVTHRDAASAVAFVTGHEDPRQARVGARLGRAGGVPGTLVVYMGVRRLAAIAEQLIAGGRDAAQPAAVIERGTLPRPAGRDRDARKRLRRAPTQRAHPRAGDRGVRRGGGAARAPALVRATAAVGRQRRGHARARPGERAGVAAARAGRRGRRGAGDQDLAAGRARCPISGRYDLVCLTSPNGVAAAVRAHGVGGLDARALSGARIAAIGPGTAAALREHGLIADVVPERFVAEGLVEALADVPVAAGARRARRRGPRRAPGRAARARRGGRRRRAV